MKNIFLFLGLFIGAMSFAQQSYESITVDGETRNYYKYLPTGYNAATEELPIVIVLHGLGGNALQMTTAGVNQIADTARFIPLYLQGMPNFLGQNAWNNGTALSSSSNDILFISKVIDEINVAHGIDLNRVYMVGVSMGAIMSFHALTVLDNRIAAISCHIGTMSSVDITNYNPTYPIPVQQIHGTNDQTVPYDSNPVATLSLVPETLDKIKTVNGWTGDSTITNIPDNVADGITIEKIEYNCTGADLEHWKMTNADHIFLYQPANDTSAIFVSWYFLREHNHPNPIAVGLDEIENGFSAEFFPNPANQMITVPNIENIEVVNIYDMNGKLLIKSIKQNTIDISELTEGMYIIEFKDNNNQVNREKLIKA
ncbi:MAG: T9SS type A sorting domain-containing protein [Putridiphycobacter sp.]